MIAFVSPVAYAVSVGLGAVVCSGLCTAARLRPGRWTGTAARAMTVILVADAVSWTVRQIADDTWSARSSLPLALCNLAVLVTAAACWWRYPPLVELTWFWGMAGALQAVATPDLNVAFPDLVFFQYVVAHVGIVVAALFLVVGMRVVPRARSIPRVLAITVGYTALVGLVDAVTGANYMFLRRPPDSWTVLRLLGPWPWYIPGAATVAAVLIVVLDSPFWAARRRAQATAAAAGHPPLRPSPLKPARP